MVLVAPGLAIGQRQRGIRGYYDREVRLGIVPT
jgi:hypothetical protein